MLKPYFWYYDAHERINRVFKLDQKQSNEIFGRLLKEEIKNKQVVDRLKQKVESLRRGKSKRGLVEKESIDKEIGQVWEKIRKFYEIINNIRNKTCRYCRYPLKEPRYKENQIGKAFSHADLHSASGYRREVILFHTECGISWLTNEIALNDKVLAKVRPIKIGQTTLLKNA